MCGAVDEVPVVSHPTAGLLDEAFEIALVTRRTVYDCLYIALAERLGCVVVTADRKHYNATRGCLYAPRVGTWVGSYRLLTRPSCSASSLRRRTSP